MKYFFKIIVVVVILIPYNTEVIAQIEDDFHSFNGVLYIPIIVDHQEEMNFKDGRKTERNNPEKKMTIQVNMNAKDMRVSNGVFSGVILNNIGTIRDEVITYKGKASKDKQKLDFIEITQEVTLFRLDTREDIEKTISLVAKFENIPKSPYGSGYKYKYGVSKIASVKYNEEFSTTRSHYVESYTEKFVKINEEQMGKYYSGVRADFKQGELKLKLKEEPKIKVVLQSNETEDLLIKRVMTVFAPGIIKELFKTPGVIIIEGIKVQKLLDEIELSQSGLVDERTKIHEGRILTPDIEIIISYENRNPEQIELPVESFVMRSKFRIVKADILIDPNFTFSFGDKKGDEFIKELAKYNEKVAEIGIHLLYE